ncbi:MAG TPA: hypothetical protein VFQ53_42835 [Kofleriaceae bacterium]|nr:hypothetical protein [Kofleriaceae bacterium]
MAARPILTTATLCAALAIAPIPSRGSPRSDPTTGRAVFTGATMPSATSIELNPAAIGIGHLPDEVYLAITSVLDQFGIDRKQIDLAADALVDAGHVSDTKLGTGAMLAFVWHAGERGTLGFAMRSPPPEQFPDDPALRYFSRAGTEQRNFIASAGTSLKISSGFYFGASLSHDNTLLHLRYSRDTALDPGRGGIDADCGGAPCGLENPAAAEDYRVDVRSPWLSTDNLKVNIGVVLRLVPDVWLGLAYHNTPGFGIQSALTGKMYVTHAPRDGGEVLRGDSTVYVSFPASVDGELRARVWDELDLHLGGRWEDLSRMQAYDVRGYGSSFAGQAIPEWQLRPRGFHDSFALWLGVEQIDTGDRNARFGIGAFRFGGRIGLETSATPTSRTSPLTLAPTSFTADGGVQWRRANWIVQLSYGLQIFAPTSVAPSAFDPRFALDCIDSGFDYATRACEAMRNGYATPTAAGDYTRLSHSLRLGLRYELP